MNLPLQNEARIALLIDADNSPAAKIDVILAELAKFGVANIRRAYGNWKKAELRGWEEVLHDYAIRPIQQFDYSKGKNATDMGMVIDAMDLLYTDRPEAFGIVSSDSDFTPLVLHLKAKGAKVYGFGAKKTPMPFVNACSRFLYLESLGEPMDEHVAAPAPAPAPAKRGRGGKAKAVAATPVAVKVAAPASPLRQDSSALKRDARLVTLLRNAVESAAGEDGWSTLGSVGQQIGNQASFDPRNYGYRKLIDLIDATQLFDLDRRGSQFVLRDKRQGAMDRGRDAVRHVVREQPDGFGLEAPVDAGRTPIHESSHEREAAVEPMPEAGNEAAEPARKAGRSPSKRRTRREPR